MRRVHRCAGGRSHIKAAAFDRSATPPDAAVTGPSVQGDRSEVER